MRKTAIIIPYFGKFPIWFDLFLYSCSKNSEIEFLFFTDCKLPQRIYDNTIFNQISFNEYCRRVSRLLDIDFNPSNPYKLCDLKPFLGIIHEEELAGFEFWGFCDVDLVFGDLSLLLSDENMRKYDLITTHDDRLAGHFTIIRRHSKFTHLCYQIKDYKMKLEDPTHKTLDEGDFSYLVYPHLRLLERIYKYFVKPFNVWHKKYYRIMNPLFCNKYSRILFKEFFTTEVPKVGDCWRYSTKNGTVRKCQGDVNLPYLHFLFFKKTPYYICNTYWKDDYYGIGDLEEVINNEQEVCVTISGIFVNNE